jgi:very-short-patch-repair endonuclease
MPAISRTEKLFAEALRREGVWFVQQARVRVGPANQTVDFYLRTKRGSEIVVEIDGGTNGNTLDKHGFKVVRLSSDEVKSQARALARRIKSKFNPETAAENRKKIAREKREIRAMLAAHEGGKRE